MKKSYLIVALALCLAFVLGACGGGGEATTTPTPSPDATIGATATPEPTPVAHSTEITYQIVEFPVTMDYSYDKGTGSAQLFFQMYDQLLVAWKGQPTDLRPMLAESYTKTDDGLTYTFKIREGVKFHNGDEITLDDVVFSINRWKEAPRTAQNGAIVDSIEKDEANHSVIVKLNSPSPANIYQLGTQISIYSEKIAGAMDPLTEVMTTPETAVGSGAYKLSEFKINEYIVLERVDDWYLNDEYFGGKEPECTKITYRLIQDVNAALIAFENGEIVATTYASDEDIQAAIAKEEEAVANGEIPEVRVTFSESSYVYGITTNLTEPVIGWRDGTDEEKEQALNFRRAMAHAIDKEALNIVVYNGYSKPVDQLTNPMTEGWVEDIEKYEYDVEKAKEYLAKSAYKGEEIEIQFISGDQKAEAFTTAVQEMLRVVGINVKPQGYEQGTWFANLYTNFDYQLGVVAYAPVVAVPDTAYRSPWHSTSAWNPWRYNDPEIDALIDAARNEQDDEKRVELYEQINRSTAASCAFIPCLNIRTAVLNNGNWMGAFPEPTWGLFKVAFMWWEEDGVWDKDNDPTPY